MTGSALAHGHAGAGGRGKRGRRLPLPVARLRARMPETRNAVLRSGFGQPPSAPAATPPTAARIPACNAAQGEIKARQAGSMEHAASPGSKKKKGARRRIPRAAGNRRCRARRLRAARHAGTLVQGRPPAPEPMAGPGPSAARQGGEVGGKGGKGEGGEGIPSMPEALRRFCRSKGCVKPRAGGQALEGAGMHLLQQRARQAACARRRASVHGQRGKQRRAGGEGRVPAKAPRGARGPLGKNGGPCPISAAVCWAIKKPRQARILGRTGGALPGRLSGGALPVRRPAPLPEPVYRPHPASPRAADRRGALK